jgi:mannose-6-phosphate isomerase-like protein (cupin superfamily)
MEEEFNGIGRSDSVFIISFGYELNNDELHPMDTSISHLARSFDLPRTLKHRYTGEQVTFLETTEETRGAHLYLEVRLPPFGKGPPLHQHDTFEEAFECRSGILSIQQSKSITYLYPGDQLVAYQGQAHTFRNDQEGPLIFRVRLTPASGFEDSMRIHYGLMEDGKTNCKGHPTSCYHTALILSLQQTWMSGIPTFLQRSLMAWLVRRGLQKGVYHSFEKYTGKPIKDLF